MPVGEKFAPNKTPKPKKPPQGRPPGPSEVSSGLAPPPTPADAFHHPESTPGSQPSFSGPPIPLLQQYGYSGSVADFNARVRGITDAFQNRFGTLPSWGHVFNVIVSPVEDFGKLYDEVPHSDLEARAQGSLSQHKKQSPYEYFIRDQNGLLQWNNPVGEMIQQAARLPAQAPHIPDEKAQQQNFNKLAKSHPWVPIQSGFLPIPGFLDFVEAVSRTAHEPVPAQIKVGGESLSEYQKQLNIAEQNLSESRPALAVSEQGRQQLGQVQGKQTQVSDIKTIQDAQTYLQGVAPDFFGDLKVAPQFNTDWASRIRAWQSTASYFRTSTQRLAEENGFGDRSDVFVKAWKSKQQAIKTNAFAAQFIRNIPLHWFALNVIPKGVGGNRLSGLRFTIYGPERSGWHLITPTADLNLVTGLAKLAVDVGAGSFQQVEADAAFSSTYMRSVGESTWKSGLTEEKARQAAFKQLEAHPSALRAAMAGELPEHPKGQLAIANVLSEVAFDIAISSPRLMGVKVKAGNVRAVRSNTYFQAKIPWAFNSLKEGNLGEAVRSLGKTRGAEQLAVKAMPLIKKGELSQDEFEHMAGSLYARGRVPLPDGTFLHGDVLPELHSYSMPKQGPAGQIASEGWAHVRHAMDDFERGLRSTGFKGTDNAANFLSFARTVLTRAAPRGTGLTERQRYLFADRTPDDIYNFTVKNFRSVEEVKDSKALATKLRDEFITARANDNVKGMVDVQDKLTSLYYKTHPADIAGRPGLDTEGPMLLSEAPTYFVFPQRQFKALTAESSMWDRLGRQATKINDKLLTFSALHRQVIVSGIPFGGFSLAYKHGAADTTRRLIGGGGPLFGEAKKVKEAKAFLDDYYKSNPSAMRFVGAEGAAAKMGEYRYMVSDGVKNPEQFRTGEKFGTKAEGQYMLAAGQDMRHLLQDDSLLAYQQASKEDFSPLAKLARTDRFHVQNWKGSEAYQEDLKNLGENPSKENIAALNKEYATSYAEALFNRYRELEEGLASSGTSLDAASTVLRKNIGAGSDKALAKFIKDNKVDYPIRSGLVANKRFDSLMQSWIGVLMTANKWNRGKMFNHVFHSTFSELHGAGWEVGDAIQASAQLAKRQTVYHMLDFSNMLQVEQDLRWVSYFATKHRLYWTWLGRTLLSRPGLANLVKNVVGPHLDNGNLNFKLGGLPLFIPAGRLFWVNSREYPESSPIISFMLGAGKSLGKGDTAGALQAGLGSVQATAGNVVTRSDQAIGEWVNFARMSVGNEPATYENATRFMAGKQAQDFNRRYNQFVLLYFHDHGVYPDESTAVKHALLAAAISETQRANMFVPVMGLDQASGLPSGQQPDRIKALFQTFGKILNPAKKRKFLDAHPELSDYFGISRNPIVKQHNDQLWAQYQVAQSAFDKAQNDLLDKVLAQGQFTPEDANTLKHLSQVRSMAVNHLKAQDKAWKGPGKKIGEPGPWTLQLEGDPLATRGFVHRMFPGLEPKTLAQGTIGKTYEDLVKTRELLVAHKYSYHADEYKTILADINQKIAVFYGTSKQPLPKAEGQYYEQHVTPYIQQRKAKQDEVNSEKTAQSGGLVLNPKTGTYEYKASLDSLETQFRAWRDAHDKPVTIMVKGKPVKFPSPVQMGWLRLPPDLKKTYLSQLAGDSYDHIADYEKHLLGLKTVKSESDGWLAYTKLLELYQREAALQGESITADQRKYIAKLVQQGTPGYSKPHPEFMKAYRFAQRPKYQRVGQTTLITDSKYKDEWKQVMSTADYFWKGIQKGSPQRQTQAVYREYVNGPGFQSWLNTTPAGFRKELSLFGPDFLNTLTS